MQKTAKTLAFIGLLAMVLPQGPRAGALESGSRAEEIVEAHVAESMAESGVPGMVFAMVGPDGAILRAFGTADLGTGRPMTVTTPMRVGSISKPVTAALALELAARGVIDLDVPVDNYLDVDLSDRYGPASTIRQLLQHRGGYPDAILVSHHLDQEDAPSLDEWVRALPDRAFAPDVVASYTSVGYTLTGAAIAAALEAEFADVADTTLFAPLGMDHASFAQPLPDDVAIGYSWDDGVYEPYPKDTPALVPGAGLTASAQDMARFMQALLADDGLLAPTTPGGLFTAAGPHPSLRAHTTGLAEWRFEGRSALYHGGNGIGTTSLITFLPDVGVGIFTSVNGEALVGIDDPSPQTMFVRTLHTKLVEELFPTSDGFAPAPVADGAGTIVEGRAGTYLPTRVDTDSVLRLEALVSQFEADGAEAGRVYYEGPDGVTYFTVGGTGSYREAMWWETVPFNAAVVGGALVLAIGGSLVAIRRSRGATRSLTALTGGFVATSIATLGYGMATVETMDLFTRVPTPIRLAGMAAAGALVSGTALVAVIAKDRHHLPTVATAASSSVAVAAPALVGWAWAWHVFPS